MTESLREAVVNIMIPPVRSGVYSVGSAASKELQHPAEKEIQPTVEPKRDDDSSGSGNQSGGGNAKEEEIHSRVAMILEFT